MSDPDHFPRPSSKTYNGVGGRRNKALNPDDTKDLPERAPLLGVTNGRTNTDTDEQEDFRRQKQGHPEAGASVLPTNPIPTLQFDDSSAWGPLWDSKLEELQPQIDDRRGALDALLVFIGLFSAIVTAFLVQSMQSLTQDQAARTNELLANLTEIVIAISKVNPESLQLRHPEPFNADPDDVRLNVFWSLSLILSISTAALAVACRIFVAKLARFHSDVKIMTKLTILCQRWQKAEALLVPILDLLPQTLIISGILFIIGLVDNLYTSALSFPHLCSPILSAAILSGIFVGAVGLSLFCAFVHGCVHPNTSPFTTTLSKSIHKHVRGNAKDPALDNDHLTQIASETFHTLLHNTHKAELLYQPVAALEAVMKPPRCSTQQLSNLQYETFKHLLSPEVGHRNNLAAAGVIANLGGKYSYNDEHRLRLIQQLIDAARRTIPHRSQLIFRSYGAEVLWDTAFTKAIVHLLQVPGCGGGCKPGGSGKTGKPCGQCKHGGRRLHPVVRLLSATHVTKRSDTQSTDTLTLTAEPAPKPEHLWESDPGEKPHPDPAPKLETVYDAASSYGFAVFAKKIRAESKQRGPWCNLQDDIVDQVVRDLNLGRCRDISQVKSLLMGLIHQPDPGLDDSEDKLFKFMKQPAYELVTAAIVRWLVSEPDFRDGVIELVLDIINDIHDYGYLEFRYQSQIPQGHNLLIVVRELTRHVATPRAFTLCVKFIHKAQKTYTWSPESDRRPTLAIIERLFTLATDNFDMLRDNSSLLPECKGALTHSLHWLAENRDGLCHDPDLRKWCGRALEHNQWLSDCHNDQDMRQWMHELSGSLDALTLPEPRESMMIGLNDLHGADGEHIITTLGGGPHLEEDRSNRVLGTTQP